MSARRVRMPQAPPRSAAAAHLRYVNDLMPGIRRVGSPGRFRYRHASGASVSRPHLVRIHALAIPPAWTDVWISGDARAHLQATGRDARHRKQYRYHPEWQAMRDDLKYERVLAFAAALPAIRARTEGDLRKPGLSRQKVLAATVQLLERTLIRIGNEEYARVNHSFGLTTLRDRHTRIDGDTVTFEFRAKSGVHQVVDLHDRRLARIVRACRDLPGHDLFQYLDADGRRHPLGSADVNAYLRKIAGQTFSAKDFRTWAGTVLAADALAGAGKFSSAAHAKRNIVRAVEAVAKRLGNTKAVCRRCYIHPIIFDAYLDGEAIPGRAAGTSADGGHVLSPLESAVVLLLERRGARRYVA